MFILVALVVVMIAVLSCTVNDVSNMRRMLPRMLCRFFRRSFRVLGSATRENSPNTQLKLYSEAGYAICAPMCYYVALCHTI